MYKQKVGISIGGRYSMPMADVLRLLKNTGFEAVSPGWSSMAELEEVAKIAKEVGLELQSLHAPFGKAAKMWSSDKAIAEQAKKDIIDSIDGCVKVGIPITVVHTWIGFDYDFDASTLYFDNYDEVVNYAKERNVKIAFENTEGEEYLFALMDRYKDNDTVGFCWDSGHEMCYNYSKDLLALFGDRLIMTHLNDNLGISRFDGVTFWTDDLHLFPYDGIADWDYNVERLKKANAMPILNFELGMGSKPNRHDNDAYVKMPLEMYFAEAYNRACRIAYKYSNM